MSAGGAAALLLGLALAAPESAGPDVVLRFEPGAHQLDPGSTAALDRLAEGLRGLPAETPVALIGHSDRSGEPEANLRLSQERAEAVRDALLARGVDRPLELRGLGAAEPLSPAEAPDGRLDRRVEVWIGPREPVARVSWILQSMQAQRPTAVEWTPAHVDLPLRPLARVRTPRDGGGEVRFSDGDALGLGPEALVVIYGRERAARRTRRRAADVTVRGGDVFARLAARDGRRIETEAAEIEPAPGASVLHVGHDEGRRRSTVSVYEGRAGVRAQGREVRVDRGFGTWIAVGEPPRPPRPLLAPSRWEGGEAPLATLADTPLRLSWATEAAVSRLEVFGAEDAELARPLRRLDVPARSETLAELAPGAYRLRLTGVDADGVVGRPGAARSLLVLPVPRLLGRPLDGRGLQRRAAQPGGLELEAVRGLELELGGSGRRHVLGAPGVQRLAYRARHGAERVELDLEVEVAAPRLRVLSLGAPEPVEGGVRVRIEFELLDGLGARLPRAELRVLPSLPKTARIEVLEPDAEGRLEGPLRPCPIEGLGPGVDAGLEADGRRSFELKVGGSRLPRRTRVAIVERSLGLGLALWVPLQR